ncbi:MAG: hypothetical protein ACKPCM_17065, partial [Pseudanabaena sp.]
STKKSLIPNPQYSPLHSLGFAQFSILWVAFSCSFSRFLNQLSLNSSNGLDEKKGNTEFVWLRLRLANVDRAKSKP